MKDNREDRPNRSRELKAVLSEACEDHLRVALIQPGGSRYEQMKWQKRCMREVQLTATRVEPRISRPLQY